MRTLISKLVVIVAFMCATSVYAADVQPMEKALSNTLSKVNAENAESIVVGMDALDRLTKQYPNEWLPLYYKTLFALQYAVHFPQDSHSGLFLESAKPDLEALQALCPTDRVARSEALVLKGLYYTALIVQNPMVNGKSYYMDAIINYKSAIGVNPDNPRAHLLLYIFFDNMSKITGQPSMNEPKELTTIKQLYASEQPQGLLPSWGKELMNLCGIK